MELKNNYKAVSYALITVLFWSTVATAFKLGLQQLDIIRLLQWAINFSLLLFFLILLPSKKFNELKKLTKQDISYFALLGFVNPFIYYLVLFKGYSLLPAQVAQPVNMIWPVLMVFMSVPILKHRVRLIDFIALILSFSGVILIATRGKFDFLQHTNQTGVAIAICSAFIWALSWLFNSKIDKPEEIKLFLNFTFAAIYINITSFLISSYNSISLYSLLPAFYIGAFEMGFSFLFWLKAMRYASSTARIGKLVYIAPFLSLVFIHFILGEKIYITTIAGIVIIILGILLQTFNEKR